MCSTCGSKTYGQEQTEARKADKIKLEKVRASMEARSKEKVNA
jgi:hypothetical protein